MGCVVECADGDSRLTPDLFGKVPAVYLHAATSFCGGRVARVSADNEAVARSAFRELSVGHPAAFGVVEAVWKLDWSTARVQAFHSLAAKAGKPCHVFPFREEGGAERTARLRDWVETLPRKCAVFAVNDRTAADVIAAAHAVHRTIPRDLTLLGVDNDVAICETSDPPLSSIQIDHERAGFLAASLIGYALAATNAKRRKDLVNSASFAAKNENATIGPLMAVWRESTRGSGRRDPHILAAVERIRREACDGLSAREVIAAAPGSRSLFNLRFREATGHSVLDEIRHVRLEKVETLLSQTSTSLGAVAALCGWGSPLSLQRFFLAQTGMTMREWRRRNRG